MTTAEDKLREKLDGGVKVVTAFVIEANPFDTTTQRKHPSALSDIKLAIVHGAVQDCTFYGRLTIECAWNLLRAAFFDWERELLDREVHLWDNVWAGRDARCKAMLAMKDFFGERS